MFHRIYRGSAAVCAAVLLSCLMMAAGQNVMIWAGQAAAGTKTEEPARGESPVLRVGERETPWKQARKADRKKAYDITKRGDFALLSAQKVPEYALEKYELRIILDECLVAGFAQARITDQKGRDLAEQFRIEQRGHQLIFSAKKTALQGDKLSGTICIVRVAAGLREKTPVSGRHLEKDGYTFRLCCGATLFLRREGGREEILSGEDVWLGGKMTSQLWVEQQGESDCKAGDIIDYRVRIRQLEENSCAVNLTAECGKLPEGLTLLGAAEAGDGKNVKLQKTKKNGWRLSCPRLEYGETIVVVYQCKVSAGLSDGSLRSTVSVRADNYRNPAGGGRRIAADTAVVWVNAAPGFSGTSFGQDK